MSSLAFTSRRIGKSSAAKSGEPGSCWRLSKVEREEVSDEARSKHAAADANCGMSRSPREGKAVVRRPSEVFESANPPAAATLRNVGGQPIPVSV